MPFWIQYAFSKLSASVIIYQHWKRSAALKWYHDHFGLIDVFVKHSCNRCHDDVTACHYYVHIKNASRALCKCTFSTARPHLCMLLRCSSNVSPHRLVVAVVWWSLSFVWSLSFGDRCRLCGRCRLVIAVVCVVAVAWWSLSFGDRCRLVIAVVCVVAVAWWSLSFVWSRSFGGRCRLVIAVVCATVNVRLLILHTRPRNRQARSTHCLPFSCYCRALRLYINNLPNRLWLTWKRCKNAYLRYTQYTHKVKHVAH